MDGGFKRVPSMFTRRKSDPDDDESIEKKVDRLFSGQEPLFERLHTEPKAKRFISDSSKAVKKKSLAGARYASRQHALVKIGLIIVIASAIGGVTLLSTGDTTDPSVNEVAGVLSQGDQSNGEKRTSDPSFKVFWPNGDKKEGAERTSPSGDKVFSYIGSIGSSTVEVSQQPLPQSFQKEQDTKLADLATASYMPNVIQIDENKAYHGYNERTKTQSVVFIKGDLLIFLKLDSKVSDEQIAGYILALK